MDQQQEPTPEIETKTYADGTVATGTAPLPELSPAEQDAADEAAQVPPVVEPEPGIPAVTLDPTNQIQTDPNAGILDSDEEYEGASSEEKVDVIEELESGMRHFIAKLEELFTGHHPEIHALKSIVNNDLQDLKKKA